MSHTQRILVVDDDESVRTGIARLLKASGYANVESAKNGEEALSLIDKTSFDCVVSDYAMPRMDGWDLLLELRFRGDLRLMKFILVSGGVTEKLLKDFTSMGAVVCLSKPVEADTLLEAVAQDYRPYRN